MTRVAKTIMIAGSMSSVGKSLLAAGLCRYFARKGWTVLPFKAQNMSNNAAVCPDGGEIGRAQAVQAFAAGQRPTVDMNPILLKPEADSRSQVIVQGQVRGSYAGRDYYPQRAHLWAAVTESLNRLRQSADLIVIEGAGGIAELNLMKSDIVNMAIARYSSAPCLIAGDIDRGGIFAQLLGSWWLLAPEDQRHIRGFIVNRFRGDATLFSDGITALEERSGGIPVLGVVPYLKNHGIADEDAAGFSQAEQKSCNAAKIVVVKLPHISNFDDFDALKYEKNLRLVFSDAAEELLSAAAIILPGTKNTITDLLWLRETGLADLILQKSAAGTPIVGICGGYQILGHTIDNPFHIESETEHCSGLGLLPIITRLTQRKTVRQSKMKVIAGTGFWQHIRGEILTGYEIHSGESETQNPLLTTLDAPEEKPDGYGLNDGTTFGTYLHGIFNNDSFRNAWLESIGIQPEGTRWLQFQQEAMDRWTDHLAEHLDMQRVEAIIEAGIEP